MATFTVNTAQDVVDPGDGRLSLREAVRQANATEAADTIRFATFLEGRTLVLSGSQLTVREDVRIDGDRNEDSTGVTIDANGKSRVLEITGSGTDARLDGLTITGGLSDGDGGGILLRGPNLLEITDSRITGNSSYSYLGPYSPGGGIFADRGSVLFIVRSSISDNRGTDGGGVFVADDSAVSIRRSSIEGNFGYDDGGGLFLDGAYATIVDSTIADNRAESNGAGIFATDSRLSLVDSTISGNAGEYRLGYGQGGGIHARDGSDISLASVTVTGNRSGFEPDFAQGGGIFISPEVPGDRVAASTLSLSDSIVAGNFNGFADGDAVAEDVDGRITESNGANVFGTAVTGNRSGDVEGVAPSRIFAAIDPETGGGRLALNGGPTETVGLRDVADNPALDAAFDADGFDQRGFVRPRPPGTQPDIGAFELNQQSNPIVAAADGRLGDSDAGAELDLAMSRNLLIENADFIF